MKHFVVERVSVKKCQYHDLVPLINPFGKWAPYKRFLGKKVFWIFVFGKKFFLNCTSKNVLQLFCDSKLPLLKRTAICQWITMWWSFAPHYHDIILTDNVYNAPVDVVIIFWNLFIDIRVSCLSYTFTPKSKNLRNWKKLLAICFRIITHFLQFYISWFGSSTLNHHEEKWNM